LDTTVRGLNVPARDIGTWVDGCGTTGADGFFAGIGGAMLSSSVPRSSAQSIVWFVVSTM
jgi:hypothetical protein